MKLRKHHLLALAAFSVAAIAPLSAQAAPTPFKLLITQVIASPNQSEAIAIYNPGANAVDLTHYFISDTNTYYTVTSASATAPGGTDFIAQFPAGASIGAGETQFISLAGAECFKNAVTAGTDTCSKFSATTIAFLGFNVYPTYEFVTGFSGDNATIPNMLSPMTGGIPANTNGLLTNGGEPVSLYFWDGTSSVVVDVDYVVYANPSSANPPVNKTLVTGYQPDTADDPATTHAPLFVPATGASGTSNTCRIDLKETGQKATGSNGIGGADETSEPTTTTFAGFTNAGPGGCNNPAGGDAGTDSGTDAGGSDAASDAGPSDSGSASDTGTDQDSSLASDSSIDDSSASDTGPDDAGINDTSTAANDTGSTADDTGTAVDDTGSSTDDTGTSADDTGTIVIDDDTGTPTSADASVTSDATTGGKNGIGGDSSGCSCDVAGGSSSLSSLGLFAALAGVVTVLFRRRR